MLDSIWEIQSLGQRSECLRLREGSESPWIEPGDWFKSFTELGPALERFNVINGNVAKVLICVPTSETVAAAISLGFSIDSFSRKRDIKSAPIAMNLVSPNDLVQFQFPWSSGEAPPRTYVGRVASIDVQRVKTLVKFKEASPDMAFRQGSVFEPSVSRVPDGVPLGRADSISISDYALTEPNFEDKDAWIRFLYQLDPRSITFSLKNRIAQFLDIQICDEIFCKNLGVEFLTLGEMARLDGFSQDTFAHFINAYEQISGFPSNSSEKLKTFERFKFVILDGNRAIDSLVNKELLNGRTTIALWEVGASALQEQALARFKESVMFNSEQIPNFDELLEWNKPAGMQIWGWKNA